MKFVLIIFLCLFSGLTAYAQVGETKENSEINVEEITLSRGDGNGKVGEATDKFSTTDAPIYCSIQLDSEKSATVKMIIMAVKAVGLKPESKIVTVSYMTKDNQNQVNFTASPNGAWAAGGYRADIFINGKLNKSRAFEIEKSSIAPEKKIAPKSFAPRPKLIKKVKKNYTE